MVQESTIQDIRKRCRMAMNGVASASMRTQGLDYKLNFGVSILQIKEISKRYTPSVELAQILWVDGTRELKILATLLFPVKELTNDIAERWIRQVPNQEIREQLCFNLLQFYPEAIEFGTKCAMDSDEDVRTTGYWLLGRRLVADRYQTDLKVDSFNYLWDDLVSERLSLRNASKLFLQNIGKSSRSVADHILSKLTVFKDSQNLIEKEVYDSLFFEFDFYYGVD